MLETLEIGHQIKEQDVTVNTSGKPVLKKGVTPERRISIEDPEMRHGRKSRSKLFDGYKRHVLTDLDLGVIRAVGITAAHEAEAIVVKALARDLESQNQEMIELHIERAYLSSRWVHERSEKFKIFCKAWPVRNGKCFDKTAFVLDGNNLSIKCPNQVTLPFSPGQVVKFPAQDCAVCPLRARCTTSKKGRSVSIPPDEASQARIARASADIIWTSQTTRKNCSRTFSCSCRILARKPSALYCQAKKFV